MDFKAPRELQATNNHGSSKLNSTTNLINIGSGNGLLPVRCQAIPSTNIDLWLIKHLGTYCNEILFETQKFSFKKMHLQISSKKCEPFVHTLVY